VRRVSYASKRVTEEIAQLAHGSESCRHYEVRQDMIRLGQLRQVGDGVGTQLNSGSAMMLRPHQVVLTVSDLDASVKFYGRFGFSPGSRIRKNDGRERVALRASKVTPASSGRGSGLLNRTRNPMTGKPTRV
jgi:hypothetical protein